MKRFTEIKLETLKKVELTDTHFSRLKNCVDDFIKGELIVIAARPGCGKTSLMLELAILFQIKYKVLIESLETSDEELLRRAKHYCKTEMIKNLYVSTSNNLSDIEKDIKTLKPDVLFIDYAQILKNRINTVTWKLKEFAKKYHCVIFLTCQLNRTAEYRDITLGMMKDSGNIEQDADQVWVLMKHCINILKNRRGPTDKIMVKFDKARYWFNEDTEIYTEFNRLNALIEKAIVEKDIEKLEKAQEMLNNLIEMTNL